MNGHDLRFLNVIRIMVDSMCHERQHLVARNLGMYLYFSLQRSLRVFVMVLLGVALTMGWSTMASANCTSSPLVASPARGPTLSGPADANVVGRQIGGWGGEAQEAYVFTIVSGIWPFQNTCQNNPWGADFAYADALDPVVPGVTYIDPTNGKSFPVYESGVPGIGYVVGIRDWHENNLNNELPLQAHTQTYPYPGSLSGSQPTFGWRARVIFIATGRLTTGTYLIPQRNIARLWVKESRAENDPSIQVPEPTYLALNPTQITLTANGCTVTNGTHQTVLMPDFVVGVDAPSETAMQREFNVSIQCDEGVQVYYTMTDASNPGNSSNVLLPSPASEAQGVGIQVYLKGLGSSGGELVNFGPDSSAIGNLNQRFFCSSEDFGSSLGDCNPRNSVYSPGGVYTRWFTASYKLLDRREVISNGVPGYSGVKPGRFEALATITFSYQ